MPQQIHQYKNNLTNIFQWVVLVFIATILLYFGKLLFAPLTFGLLIALIAYPVCLKMEKKGLSRVLSIASIIVFITLVFAGLTFLLGFELNLFLSDFPLLLKRLSLLNIEATKWIDTSFGISPAVQSNWFQKINNNIGKDITGLLRNLLNTTVSTIIMLVMVPIYATLFLYHRETFVHFLEVLAGKKYQDKLHIILHKSVFTYFNFIKGNFYVYCIVGLLNFIGLLALGIENALLFGMLTSFMMIIPYIGILISAAIPVSIALITKDSVWYPIGVITVFVFVQYLESNILFPKIVGTQLHLSTWSTLVAIVAGTVVWGIAGIVLVTPFLAMLKIITDYIPEWKALNILLNRNETFLEYPQKN